MKDEPHALAKLASWATDKKLCNKSYEASKSFDFEDGMAKVCLKNLDCEHVSGLTHYLYQLGFVITSGAHVPRAVIEKAISVIPLLNQSQLSILVPLRWKVMPVLRVKLELACLQRFMELLQDQSRIGSMMHGLCMFQIFACLFNLFDQDQLKLIYDSELYKWIKVAVKSTDTVKSILAVFRKVPHSRFEPEGIIEYMLDAMIENNGRAHSDIHKYLAQELFFSRKKIPVEKIEKYMSLVASCLLRDFETVSGMVTIFSYFKAPSLVVFIKETCDKMRNLLQFQESISLLGSPPCW